MLVSVLSVAVGLVFLTGGATALVRGAASLALRLGLTPLVVGLTVVAFGTSAPELVVSVGSTLSGAGGIAVGNVVGSNIANVGLILALAVLVRPFAVEPALLRRDLPLLIAATALSVGLLLDGRLGRVEGAVLVAGLVGYLVWSIRQSRAEARVAAEAVEGVPAAPTGPVWLDVVLLLVGLAALAGGAELLVRGAVAIAEAAGVSDAVIGLTVVAVGTSLPELATSAVAAVRGQSEIAAGNVVGSNLFNLLGILGIAALVRPLDAPGLAPVDLWTMGAFTLALVPFMVSGKRLIRVEGAVLLVAYVVYVGYLVVQHG